MKATDAIAALASLAQETRLAVFRMLVRAGARGLSPGELADALDVPGPTLSFHLNHLIHAGLIARCRQGRSLRYSVRFETMRTLLGYLSEDCCQGRPELCGLPPARCGAIPARARR